MIKILRPFSRRFFRSRPEAESRDPWPVAFSEDRNFLDQFDAAKLVLEGDAAPEGRGNQVAFIGRNSLIQRPAANIFGRFDGKARRNRFKVVCFYTNDNEYKELAAHLKETLDRFKIEHEFEEVNSLGAWEVNCSYKARFIRKKWRESEVPVVWLDADATVEAPPVLFAQIEADFSVHKWHGKTSDDQGWQMASGTLYFGKTPLAGQLIEQWCLRCEADPITWDQEHLSAAWCDISSAYPLRTIWLPRAYLQIADAQEFSSPVVKHWQASRASKQDGRAIRTQAPRYTANGIHDRFTNRLWRTPEEGFWIKEGVEHIKPEIGHEYPEGFDVGSALRQSIAGSVPVLEIGCGVGRIAAFFDEGEYLGVDVNPAAIARARCTLPKHDFRIHDHGLAYPDAPTALIYTVLLHVADAALPALLEEIVLRRDRVIIAEIMDSRWRRDGNPPVFNRNPEDYILMMERLGFMLSEYRKYAYERYQNQGHPQDTRMTFLRFDRKNLSPPA